jgi:hypothetical protein
VIEGISIYLRICLGSEINNIRKVFEEHKMIFNIIVRLNFVALFYQELSALCRNLGKSKALLKKRAKNSFAEISYRLRLKL